MSVIRGLQIFLGSLEVIKISSDFLKLWGNVLYICNNDNVTFFFFDHPNPTILWIVIILGIMTALEIATLG